MAKRSQSRLRDLASVETGKSSAPRFIPGDDGGGPILGRWAFIAASLLGLGALIFGAIVFGTENIEESLEFQVTRSLREVGLPA